MDGGVRRVTGDGGEGRSHPENSDGNHYREEDMIQITLQRSPGRELFKTCYSLL